MNLGRALRVSVGMTVLTTVVLGLAYPLAVTAVSELVWPERSHGRDVGEAQIGATLIGQPFVSSAYFWGRPSAAGKGYDAGQSGGSNLGPTSQALIARVRADVARLQDAHPGQPVPLELVTTSASGLDPHVTPAAAAYQVARVARHRGVEPAAVQQVVDTFTEPRTLGVFGEPRVNVLQVNRELDRRWPVNRPGDPARTGTPPTGQ